MSIFRFCSKKDNLSNVVLVLAQSFELHRNLDMLLSSTPQTKLDQKSLRGFLSHICAIKKCCNTMSVWPTSIGKHKYYFKKSHRNVRVHDKSKYYSFIFSTKFLQNTWILIFKCNSYPCSYNYTVCWYLERTQIFVLGSQYPLHLIAT